MSAFPVVALRSVELTTPDLRGSADFYTQVWGLDFVAEADGRLFLAATGDDFHVLSLIAGDGPALCKITFRVRSREDLVSLHARMRAAGCPLVRDLAPCSAPSGGEAFMVREAQGCHLEFVFGDRRKSARCAPDRPERLAHVNINSQDLPALSAFYQDALGFRLTDRSKAMNFLRCRSDHHTIVLADAAVNGLNHVAFQMPDLESTMRGAGRMIDRGYPLGWGVGRHGPGDNAFAYFVDPTGVVVEYTAEVIQVDESYVVKGPHEWVWPPGRTDQWGVAPPKSEACKKAQTSVPFASGPCDPLARTS